MTQHDPALRPIEELAQNVSQPFESARAMPKSVYTSEAFVARELETIFARDWLCAGRADALKEPGDYLTMDIAGEPIIAKLTEAPGNGAAIGGLKVVTESAWFAARPSGTEDVYKIYAESFVDEEHLKLVQREAKALVDGVIG